MNLIVLYGPPGVGKYTVGKLLAERLNYEFVHNHEIVDRIPPVYTAGSLEFAEAGWELFFETLENALQKKSSGMVTTFVYEKDVDDPYVEKTIARVRDSNGTSAFIRLTCSTDELMRRVENASRMGTQKITSRATLDLVLKERNITDTIPGVTGFTVDTSALTPQETVHEILRLHNPVS